MMNMIWQKSTALVVIGLKTDMIWAGNRNFNILVTGTKVLVVH